jgi:hypothetical protein
MKRMMLWGMAAAALLVLAAGGTADAAKLKQPNKGSTQSKGGEKWVQVQSSSTGVSPGGKARGALAVHSFGKRRGTKSPPATTLRAKGKQTKSGGASSYGSYRLVFPTTK